MAKVRVLSIDGGGVRGIIPATVLAYLENKLIERTGNSKTRISNFLDFAAGTSTGSIISALAITPTEEGKPPMKMEDVVKLYFELAAVVFKKDWKRNLKTLWGLLGPRYSSKPIDDILLNKLDHWRLSELVLPCAFTGYDTAKRRPIIYTNSDDKEKYGNYFIKDVVRGSTAIPSAFSPANFRDGVDVNTIIDGGVFANNPSLVAYIEMLKTKEISEKFVKSKEGAQVNQLNPTNVIILSFGTGRGTLTTYPNDKIKNWGMIKWFGPVLNILLQGMGDVTAYEVNKLFEVWDANENYIRINPDIKIGSANGQDASAANMRHLHQDALNYISDNKEFLDNLAERLIKEDLRYASFLF